VTKRSRKTHARAKRIGAYLVNDDKRQAGGLIYTVAAIRDRERQFGKLGAASGVRRIDPETGAVIEEISLQQIEQQKQGAEAGYSKTKSRAL